VQRVAASAGLPRWIYVPAAMGALFVVVPLIAVAAKVDWPHFWSLITSESSTTALVLSLKTAAASTTLCVLLGVPMAMVLARSNARLVRLARPLILLPLVLPPVVGGIALLLAYGRRGFIGEPLDKATGITLPFTLAGVIVAESFVAMPFFVITVESGLRSMNRRLEDAARSLGAKRWTVFRRVTLPLIWPSLAAGTVLTWARALGEFGATITFAGNLPGVTQTMPLAIYISQSSGRMDEAIALSLVLVVVSLVVMIFRRRLAGGD
jgi:molybdate transport system permease protein